MSPKHHFIIEVSAMVAALVASLLPLGDAIGAAAKGDGYPQLSTHRQFKPINGDTTVNCEFGHEIPGGGKRVTLFEVNFRENDISTRKVRCPEAGDRPGFEIGRLKSISSASNEETEKICLAGIAALKKKIRTYTDLCAENYQTAMRALRA
ncbi:hypothetical protein FOZ63_001398, partial [Perkinsus olseni]